MRLEAGTVVPALLNLVVSLDIGQVVGSLRRALVNDIRTELGSECFKKIKNLGRV